MSEKTHPAFKDLLGMELELNGETYFVVGVHPEIGISFQSLKNSDEGMWLERKCVGTSYYNRIFGNCDIETAEQMKIYNQLFINNIKAVEVGFKSTKNILWIDRACPFE